MDKKNVIILALCIFVPLSIGFIGSYSIGDSLVSWYPSLHKSPLTPPSWLFSPIWTLLYILMGLSAFIVILWGRRDQFFTISISLFVLQLGLNALWTLIFFKLRSPTYAYFEILILDAVVLLMVYSFGKISWLAQVLILPYVIWLGFATYLNWYVASF